MYGAFMFIAGLLTALVLLYLAALMVGWHLDRSERAEAEELLRPPPPYDRRGVH